MITRRAVTIVVVTLALGLGDASGQTTTSPMPAAPPAALPDKESEPENVWSFSASASAYFVPDTDNYVQPTIAADRDWFHLEARYNYEDLDTGSVWLGYNFSGGKELTWELTPMLGGVFGEVTGLAPGYKGSLSWWKLELYSEGEFVIDTRDKTASFFYNWSELTIAPVDWLRFGLVTQRTRAYHTDREIERGLLVGLTYKNVNLTTYVFNPDESRPTVVVAVSVEF